MTPETTAAVYTVKYALMGTFATIALLWVILGVIVERLNRREQRIANVKAIASAMDEVRRDARDRRTYQLVKGRR